MISSQPVVSPFANRNNMQVMLAAVLGVVSTATIDQNDPKVMKAYGKVSAIEPIVAYLASKRGKRIMNVEDMNRFLADIRDNNINVRERLGIAKIYNAHKRIGNFFAKGLEGITDEKYGPSLALAMQTGAEIKSEESWSKKSIVQKGFAGLQAIVVKYFEAQPKFVLN